MTKKNIKRLKRRIFKIRNRNILENEKNKLWLLVLTLLKLIQRRTILILYITIVIKKIIIQNFAQNL